MHPDRMRLAAEHLRLNAQCLFESCTVNGRWDGEHPDEQKDCAEMVALADEIEHAAGCLPNTVLDGNPPHEPNRAADVRTGDRRQVGGTNGDGAGKRINDQDVERSGK